MRGRLAVVAIVAVAAAASALSFSGGGLGSTSGAGDVDGCVDDVAGFAGESTPERLAGVVREVERMRRLRFRKTPKPRYLRRAPLQQRVRRQIETSYPDSEAAVDGRALAVLGALRRGTNLKALLKRSLPGQVAGFYDPRTRQLVVGSNTARELDAVERLTLAHELDHALTDQALGLPSFLDERGTRAGQEDAELAALSLVEGDATLLTEAFATRHLSLVDAFRSIGPVLSADDQFGKLPHYLQASTIFPYEEGMSFACRLFERGGWKAVDRAYRRLPTTSAQIMFPERYLARERAIDPPDSPAPARGWKLLDKQAFGAAHLLWLFQAPGGDPAREPPDARDRAAAWAGGELLVWQRGKRTAATVALVERRGELDLCASMRAWLRAAKRKGGVACSGRIIRARLLP